MTLLVSAIINNYNYGRFLGEAIDSVLNQTYENIELIIVDDGSTDQSCDIIENYVRSYPNRITAIFKENGGQASAFNSGFELAKGEIICFLDSDDYWFPTKIEKVVEAHKIADIVEHSSLINGESCRWLKDKKNASYLMKEKGRLLSFSETSALSFKKNLLKKFFPIPEKGLEICTDVYVFYTSLYFTQKVVTLKEVLSYYRIHGNNNFQSNKTAHKGFLPRIVELINEFLIANDKPIILYGNKRIVKVINDLEIKRKSKYALYGTGSVGEKVFTKVTDNEGIVTMYVESKLNEKNAKKDGIPIISVNNLSKQNHMFDYVIIASSYQEEILSNLLKYNIPKEKIIELPI